MAIYSGVLAWEIPWTEEPGGVTKSQTTEQLNMHAQPKAKFLNVLYIDNVNI